LIFFQQLLEVQQVWFKASQTLCCWSRIGLSFYPTVSMAYLDKI